MIKKERIMREPAEPKIVKIKREPANTFVKPEFGLSWFTQLYCNCGCRLRTDGKIVFCSGSKCDFHEDIPF